MNQIENLTIEERVKKMVVKRLSLDILPQEITDEGPLFGIDDSGVGLGLDSVDALELVVGINEEFNIKINSENKKFLYSVKTISDFVRENI